jgi:hypothetical protein
LERWRKDPEENRECKYAHNPIELDLLENEDKINNLNKTVKTS